jgi:UDP-N-acetylmuramate--alanine ligase
MDAAVEKAAAAAGPGDVIITLGAGNVSQAGERLLERLAARQEGLRQERLTAAS